MPINMKGKSLLTVEQLTAAEFEYLLDLADDLKAKNAAVVEATIPVSNARVSRNEILYKENTGLCDVAMDVKTYIKSVFGATSPQYKQISKLEFKKVKV